MIFFCFLLYFSCCLYLNIHIASPSGLSSGLKNLLSTAIGDESPSKAAAPSTVPTASAGVAPTLTRLLELPLNAPGKPLPELAPADGKTCEEAPIDNATSVAVAAAVTTATATITAGAVTTTAVPESVTASSVSAASDVEQIKHPEPVAVEEVKEEEKEISNLA